MNAAQSLLRRLQLGHLRTFKVCAQIIEYCGRVDSVVTSAEFAGIERHCAPRRLVNESHPIIIDDANTSHQDIPIETRAPIRSATLVQVK